MQIYTIIVSKSVPRSSSVDANYGKPFQSVCNKRTLSKRTKVKEIQLRNSKIITLSYSTSGLCKNLCHRLRSTLKSSSTKANLNKPLQTVSNRQTLTKRSKAKDHHFLPLPPPPTKSSSSARAINLSKTRSRLRAREPGRGERVEWEKERARVPSNDSASRHVSRYASYGNVSAGSWPNVEKKGYGARARWLA